MGICWWFLQQVKPSNRWTQQAPRRSQSIKGESMNTRKYPRTMQEAFGPYTSHQIEDREERYKVTDLVIYALFVVVLFLVLSGVIGK
jgi:hypothetical protein